MKTEVLVSAVNADERELYRAMNLRTDAVIVNQCDRMESEKFENGGCTVSVYRYAERGIGKSRNCALMHSTADICIFADDDMVFADDYEKVILSEFESNPRADGILFSIDVQNSSRPVDRIEKNQKMNLRTAMRYGIPAFAVKREVLLKKNIWFSLMFGGGARYGSGEDTVFFKDMVSKGMNIFINKACIARTDAENSSWFKGFNQRFFMDKGALYAAMIGNKARLSVAVSAYRWSRKLGGEYSFGSIYRYMCEGIDEYLSKY